MSIKITPEVQPKELILDSFSPQVMKITLRIETDGFLKGDVIIAVDCSESMQSTDYRKEKRKDIITKFTHNLDSMGAMASNSANIGIIGWHKESISSNFMYNIHDINEYVEKKLPLDDEPETNFHLALETSINMLLSSPRSNSNDIARLIIFITDGIRDGNADTFTITEELRKLIRDKGIRIFVIGFNMPKPSKDFFTETEKFPNVLLFNYHNKSDNDGINDSLIEALKLQIAKDATLKLSLSPYLEPYELTLPVRFKHASGLRIRWNKFMKWLGQ
jgi:hypothetical protein